EDLAVDQEDGDRLFANVEGAAQALGQIVGTANRLKLAHASSWRWKSVSIPGMILSGSGLFACRRRPAMLEVEVKYRAPTGISLEERILALGAEPVEEREDADAYFNAPHRDFARTDEAFRLRRIGPANFLTY